MKADKSILKRERITSFNPVRKKRENRNKFEKHR